MKLPQELCDDESSLLFRNNEWLNNDKETQQSGSFYMKTYVENFVILHSQKVQLITTWVLFSILFGHHFYCLHLHYLKKPR